MEGKAMKRFLAGILAAAAIAVAGSAADAHPRLKMAGPAPGSTVKDSPKAIRIQFTEAIELPLSGVEVKDQAGKMQKLGAPAVSSTDKAQLVVPVEGALKPGKYTVAWHAVGDDTHRQTGSFNFVVKPIVKR
jgi:methionine-rich copper-binding protein CopC